MARPAPVAPVAGAASGARSRGGGRRRANETFAREVVERVRDRVVALAGDYTGEGRSLGELGAPDEVAGRMLAALPEASAWDDALGPFYGSAQVARLLGGVSRQALAERRERRTILALSTSDGAYVYPVFQFDARRHVVPGLAGVLQLFDGDADDDWALAAWLRAPQRALGRLSVIEWLRAGRDPTVVEALGREQAARFRQ